MRSSYSGIAVALFITGACAGRAHTRSTAPEQIASARVVVTAAELARFRAANSLMEALDAMHPAWLASGGRALKVSIDGAPPADYSALFYLPVYLVVEVSLRRVGSIGKAMTTTGGHVVVGGDLLLVRTR